MPMSESGDPAGRELAGLLRARRRVVVLTGAGCSTGSGIPDYRDAAGEWKQARPILYPDFVSNAAVRSRYWSRSLLGWPRFAAAAPNPAHEALAALERRGVVTAVVTQNVDGLHQAAGSRAVIDLHGRLDRVRCLACGTTSGREAWQTELARANPEWTGTAARAAPDGDAIPADGAPATFRVPGCQACGGLVKPDVVFYGEAVPDAVRRAAEAAVAAADALLVVGSSLMVYSGYRLVREASRAGKPVMGINLGRTRADELLNPCWRADCTRALPEILTALAPPAGTDPTARY
jgi:NAD-dependent SIR2 family protein deacetylase